MLQVENLDVHFPEHIIQGNMVPSFISLPTSNILSSVTGFIGLFANVFAVDFACNSNKCIATSSRLSFPKKLATKSLEA